MPEITFIGWIHTAVAIIAIVSGFLSLVRHKVILPENRSGQIYLIGTLITAVTALAIYQLSEPCQKSGVMVGDNFFAAANCRRYVQNRHHRG